LPEKKGRGRKKEATTENPWMVRGSVCGEEGRGGEARTRERALMSTKCVGLSMPEGERKKKKKKKGVRIHH